MQQSYYSCYYMLLCIQILITTNRNMVVKLQQQRHPYSLSWQRTCFIFVGLVLHYLTHDGTMYKYKNVNDVSLIFLLIL